jgi:hypothetical protein
LGNEWTDNVQEKIKSIWITGELSIDVRENLKKKGSVKLKKEFEPKFIPDNPLTENPYDYKSMKKMSIPKEDTHAGTGIKEINGKADEIDAENLLGDDD